MHNILGTGLVNMKPPSMAIGNEVLPEAWQENMVRTSNRKQSQAGNWKIRSGLSFSQHRQRSGRMEQAIVFRDWIRCLGTLWREVFPHNGSIACETVDVKTDLPLLCAVILLRLQYSMVTCRCDAWPRSSCGALRSHDKRMAESGEDGREMTLGGNATCAPAWSSVL